MTRSSLTINPRLIAYICGQVLAFLAVILGLMTGPAIFLDDGTWPAFCYSALAAATSAGLLIFLGRRQRAEAPEIRGRDGLAVVGLAWPLIILAGALPYLLSGLLPGFMDALFESASGFTTTGATILTDLDQLPPGLLLWRALTHWLGGMGVIVLMLAVLPFLGVSGLHLFRNESSLGQARFRPRIAQTAKILWTIYLGLTVILVTLAKAFGLSWFEAVCNGLSAVGTGGFATRNLSIGHYGHPGLEVLFTVFMFLGSLNFALYYQAARGDWRSLFKDTETRVYTLIIVLSALFISLSLMAVGHYGSPWETLRQAFFQVVSVTSTAGLASADWLQWPGITHGLIFGLFFLGGCTGSTSGGVKCLRWILLFKGLHRDLRQHIHHRAVIGLRLGDHPVPERLMTTVWSFWALYLVVLAASALALTALDLDILSALAASASALGNVGLDLGLGFSSLPTPAKGILILEMLLGRLEFFTLLILFLPEFWTR
ncbi:MAG: TrkH family potassium uptake protein [Candidatus Adiutrix sp.]|jgi:trk system potassium uptake protein TrkH|nr:TrkH family potassium uptake protein [Candidatus Adiutrix sp.]